MLTEGMSFAEYIKKCRQAAGLTMTEAAEMSGRSVAAWSNLEAGKSKQPERIEDIAKALGRPVQEVQVASSRHDIFQIDVETPFEVTTKRLAKDFDSEVLLIAYLRSISPSDVSLESYYEFMAAKLTKASYDVIIESLEDRLNTLRNTLRQMADEEDDSDTERNPSRKD